MGDAKDDRTLEVSPAPWRWRDDHQGLGLYVEDAQGRFMFAVDLGERIPSPGERALIAAAPEMAALLREAATLGGARCTKRLGGDPVDRRGCMERLDLRGHEDDWCIGCRLAALLARLPKEGA